MTRAGTRGRADERRTKSSRVVLPDASRLSALFPPLMIDAARVARSVWQGAHGRRAAGSGESFWQFRRYAPGDGAERIDWRQSARTDKIYVREREREAAQSVWLWADGSGSMLYASQKDIPSKAERARVLMLALAGLLLRGGEKITWLGAEPLSAHGNAGLERIASRLPPLAAQEEREREGREKEGEGPACLPLPHAMPRYAHMILCSDFLMPPEALKQRMADYAALRLRGAFLHILDPAEAAFPFEGRVEMAGCEGETPRLLSNAAALRVAYLRRLHEHEGLLRHVAASAGWAYVRHVTDEKPELALMRLYTHLATGEGGQ